MPSINTNATINPHHVFYDVDKTWSSVVYIGVQTKTVWEKDSSGKNVRVPVVKENGNFSFKVQLSCTDRARDGREPVAVSYFVNYESAEYPGKTLKPGMHVLPVDMCRIEFPDERSGDLRFYYRASGFEVVEVDEVEDDEASIDFSRIAKAAAAATSS